MSNDISTPYTKYCNKEEGRKGYCAFKDEKETVIRPKQYGMFLADMKKRRRNR